MKTPWKRLQLLLILGLLFVIQATVKTDKIDEGISSFFVGIYHKALGLFKTLDEESFRNLILDNLWVLIPLAILLVILKKIVAILTSSSSEGEYEGEYEYKGEEGELIVNLEAESLLDKDKYHLLKNVTLRTGDGTTQIDHIIISIYGVFVVETKNMTGWIFGNPKQKTWTQIIYEDRYRFQNPLH